MNTNITIKEKSYDVLGGPSKDALFEAFKHTYDKGFVVPIDFKVAVGYTGLPSDPKTVYIAARIENLRITSMEHEDGSGESFNLKGYCDADLGVNRTRCEHYRFRAYFDTKRRIGHMTFVPQP